MRCENCSKFVGMENGDPEVQSLDMERDGDTWTVTAEVRGTRCCAECSTELKELSISMEQEFKLEGNLALEQWDEWDKLTKEQQEGVRAEIAKDDVTTVLVSISEGDAEASESGGGRYAKNMIHTELDCDLVMEVTLPDGDVRLQNSLILFSDNAASEFEEC